MPFPLIYIAPGFLDPETCGCLRAAMDRGVAEPAEVLDHGASLDLEARRATAIEIDLAVAAVVDARLDAARPAIADYYKVVLRRREGSAFLRYGPGGFYGRHRDFAVDAGWQGAAERRVSLVTFLNTADSVSSAGEFSGGELVIHLPEAAGQDPQTCCIAPRQGCLVAFPSDLLHEVQPVTAGVRDVVVDWYY
jgi:predicted 2-oxoglutarate/Fe(II)-dependent dioxygenase YbiX